MKKTTAVLSGTTAGILSNAGALGLTVGSTVCWPLVIGAAAVGYGIAALIGASHRSQRELMLAAILEECLQAQDNIENTDGRIIDI